jgi:hypothetical protein
MSCQACPAHPLSSVIIAAIYELQILGRPDRYSLSSSALGTAG